MKKLLIFTSFAALFVACQKASNTIPPDPSKLIITLQNPQNGAVYHKGDTVKLNATATYITELHGYEVAMTDSATGDTLWDYDIDLHDDHFTIAEQWADTLTKPTTMLLNLTVEIDHNGHKKDTMVKLYSH